MDECVLVLVSAAVLVDEFGRILLAQRPVGKNLEGLWEFPGGKLEPGESPETALVRELQEELAITAETAALEPLTFASHHYDKFHLLMPVYLCRKWRGVPQAVEHTSLVWVRPPEAVGYPMVPADIPLLPVISARI